MDREGVKRKLEFMDEGGRGTRVRRGNLLKSSRIYSLGRGGTEIGKRRGELDEDLEEGGSNEGTLRMARERSLTHRRLVARRKQHLPPPP